MSNQQSEKININKLLTELSNATPENYEKVCKKLKAIKIADKNSEDYKYYKEVLNDLCILCLIFKVYNISIPYSEYVAKDSNKVRCDEDEIIEFLKKSLSDKYEYNNIIESMSGKLRINYTMGNTRNIIKEEVLEERLREVTMKFMLDNGYNQKQLADFFGLSKSTVSKFLSGKSYFNMTIAEKLMKYYNCSLLHLLNLTKVLNPINMYENRPVLKYFYNNFISQARYLNTEDYTTPEIIKYISYIHRAGNKTFEEYLKKTREFMEVHNISTDSNFIE